MSNQPTLLNLWSNHHARCVHQADDGDIECITNLPETSSLVRSWAIDGTTEIRVVVSRQPKWMPFDSDERRDHSDAEFRP